MIPRFLRPEVFPTTFTWRAVARLSDSAPPPPTVCAWCPDFDPTTQALGPSLGLCQACSDRALFETMHQIDRPEDDRDELLGDACGAACGYCGRCS